MKFPNLRNRKADAPAVRSSNDLGLGDKVARQPGTRLINDDGSLNVVREGRSIFAPYQSLVEMSWPRFLLYTLISYVIINLVFAVGFLIIGTDSLSNIGQEESFGYRFLGAFFFSVQTFTTVGYGSLAPVGIAANALAAFVALFGWIALAIVTGLFYARFARPTRLILFSDHAIIAPYGPSGKSLQFRIANKRDSNLINVNARVVLTWLEGERRRFAPLDLERNTVPLFPLNWTIVHPITEDSPMAGWFEKDYCRRHSELLITIDGYDETFAQTVHLNNSYLHDEIIWNARFEPMYFEREMTTELHLDRIHSIRGVEEEE
ncbi:MAG: ion channel [Bacteroidota bacterium]